MKKTIMIIMAVVGVGLVCAEPSPALPRTRPKLASPRSLVQLNRTLVEVLNTSEKTGGAIDLLRKRLAKKARVAPVELVYDAIDQLVLDLDAREPVVRKLRKYQTALVDGNISHAVMIDKRERQAPTDKPNVGLSGSSSQGSVHGRSNDQPLSASKHVGSAGRQSVPGTSPNYERAGGNAEMVSRPREGLRPQAQGISPAGRVGRLGRLQVGEQAQSHMQPGVRPQTERMIPDGSRPQPRQQIRPRMQGNDGRRPASRPRVQSDYQAEMRHDREWEQVDKQDVPPPPPAMIAALLERMKEQHHQEESDQEHELPREHASNLSIQDIRMLLAQTEQASGRPTAHAPHVDIGRIQVPSEYEPKLGLLPDVPTSSPLVDPEAVVSVVDKPSTRPHAGVPVGMIGGREREPLFGREATEKSASKPLVSLEDIVKEALAKMPHEEASLAKQPGGIAHTPGQALNAAKSSAEGNEAGYQFSINGAVTQLGQAREETLGTSSEALVREEAPRETGGLVGAVGFGPFHAPIREMPPEEFLDHIQSVHDVPREQLAPIPADIGSLSVAPLHAPSREFDQKVVEHDPAHAVGLLYEKMRREELLRPETDFLKPPEKSRPKPRVAALPEPKPEDMALTTKNLVVNEDAAVRGAASVGGCLDLGGFGVFDACSSHSWSDYGDQREKPCPKFLLGSEVPCSVSNRLHVAFSSSPILFIDTQQLASSATPLFGILPIDTMFSGHLELLGCHNALVNEPAIKVIPVSIGDTALAVPTWVDMNILFSIDLGTSFKGPITAVGGFQEGCDYTDVVQAALQSGLIIYPPAVYFSRNECGALNVNLKLTFFQMLIGAVTGSDQAGLISRAAEAAIGLLTTSSMVIFYDGVPNK